MNLFETSDDGYAEFVNSKTKTGADILADLTPAKVGATHAALGIAGEAGELVDEIKKAFAYGRDADMSKVMKEMGDLEFYMQMLRNELGLEREDVIHANVIKLSERYNKGFTDKEAAERRDVKGG